MKVQPVRFSWLACFMLLAASAASAQVAPPADVARKGVRAIEAAGGGSAHATYSAVTGRVSFLALPKGHGVPTGVAAGLPAQDRALAFLRAHGATFGMGPESQPRVTAKLDRDEAGLEHVRVRQEYHGVPVVAGELMVHLRGADVVAVNGRALPDLSVDTVPAIGPEKAIATVREFLRKHRGVEKLETSAPELQVLDRGLLDGGRWPTRLVWFVEARSASMREFVWVDAHAGAIALHFDQRPDALDRTVYTAANGASLPGSLIGSEASPPTGDSDAAAAFTFAGDTYDYFLSRHGRDSFDGAGAEIRSTVHYCEDGCPFQNAFWNGQQMVYGEGFAAADDVVAHELTHAVTERTAGLFYYMQSGALNESYSDIFGEAVDLLNGKGTDTPDKRWLMGEDLPVYGPIRNLMDPSAFGDPGRVGDGNFACGGADGNNDGGDVHRNSGVTNHAYALMVDGGAYNGVTVRGIGQTKADRIEYRALTRYLLTGSDFLDNYEALKQSCTDLVGSGGITTADCTEVGKALDAVAMNQPWSCTPPQPAAPALCPAGQVAVDAWKDDFENTTSGRWTTSLLSGTYNHWTVAVTGYRTGTGDSSLYYGDFAASGRHHLWGYDHDYTGDSSVQMASPVTLPAGARLQFLHSFGFENTYASAWDGGVLEYCTGACAAWSDAGSLISGGAGYTGTISDSFGNPLGGRAAFTGESWGYTATQMDLGTLAGQAFRLRFRMGTDSSVQDYGWFVDDVRIYQCQTAATPTLTSFTPASGAAGTTVTVTGTGFTGATAVAFNGVSAAFDVVSATSISATVPNGAATGPITVTTPGGTATSGTSFSVPVVPATDLSVVTTGPYYARRGGSLVYTTVVTNNGPVTANAVVLDATGPIGLGDPVNTGACVTGFPCNLGSLDSGAQATVTTTVGVPVAYSPSPIVVTTSLSSSTPDSNLADNTATVTTRFGSFYTVAPCRLVDTRAESAPALQPGERRSFTFAGSCSVPAGATALALNVTVTGGTSSGNLRLYPSDAPGVPNVSTVNFTPGLTRANNAVILASADGNAGISITNDSPGTVQLVLDVTGYFE